MSRGRKNPNRDGVAALGDSTRVINFPVDIICLHSLKIRSSLASVTTEISFLVLRANLKLTVSE
ncbi:hypothetical protein D3C73_1565800 [compost metagenome]